MFKRIWPDTIRATVFHTTDLAGLENLKKLEGGKKSISAFFSMMSRYMETGVATSGDVHVVVEMDADVLVSAKDDIWSQVDKTGRRWVELSWFASATRTGPKFDKVEKDLNTLITNLVKKHLTKILGKNTVISTHEYELWGAMKRHLHGDGQKLRLVIKDYFDGVEKVLKKNSEVMGNILYGYAKGKRMTDNAWDEQVVNNIKIKKVHIWPDSSKEMREEDEDEIKKQITDIKKWPIKAWDATIELEIYTRAVVAKEIGRTVK
jgi:flagellar capping protein FliD